MRWNTIRRCSATRVVIVGAGDATLEQTVVERSARLASLEPEIGFVSARRKRELFSKADVVVLPYTRFHSQSGVLADAYSYRVPLVVADVGALGTQFEMTARASSFPQDRPTPSPRGSGA